MTSGRKKYRNGLESLLGSKSQQDILYGLTLANLRFFSAYGIANHFGLSYGTTRIILKRIHNSLKETEYDKWLGGYRFKPFSNLSRIIRDLFENLGDDLIISDQIENVWDKKFYLFNKTKNLKIYLNYSHNSTKKIRVLIKHHGGKYRNFTINIKRGKVFNFSEINKAISSVQSFEKINLRKWIAGYMMIRYED